MNNLQSHPFFESLNRDSPFLVQTHNIDDFTGVVGSFSSKSINTYDESNQSVAQELNTNESIAMQSYTIANMKQQTGVPINPKMMNSDDFDINN